MSEKLFAFARVMPCTWFKLIQHKSEQPHSRGASSCALDKSMGGYAETPVSGITNLCVPKPNRRERMNTARLTNEQP